MKPPAHLRRKIRRKRGAGFLVALAAAAGARGQPPDLPPLDEPTWFTWRWSQAYVSLDAEGEQETGTSNQGGVTTVTRRIYLAPSVGIGGVGSVYHPDLLTLSVQAEPGYVWQEIGAPGAMATQSSILQSYNVSANVLQLKPYSTTLFANASHDIQEYDFFNSVVADQQTWGVNTGYRAGSVPVTVAFQDSHQDISGISQNTSYDQLSLNLHAHSDRDAGNVSDLTFLYGQFDQTVAAAGAGATTESSGYQQLNATDVEHFGNATLNSTLIYNGLISDGSASQTVTPILELRVDHTDHFHSFYGYSFSHYDDDLSDYNQNYAHAGVHHQLFESLSSSLDLHGTEVQDSGGGSSFDSVAGGVLGSVNYSKKLGSWGRLSIGNSLGFDLTDQSTSGASVFVPQESHSATAATPQFRLTQPRETTITTVTSDAAHGFQPLQEGIDYFVDRTVDPWQITVNFASLTVQRIENTGTVTVLVSYDVTPNPSGSYSTVSYQGNIRLDLFGGLLGLYTRLQRIQNHVNTPGFVLENLDELEGGANLRWAGLRLDAKYLSRHSSLYEYNAKTLAEGYTMKVDGASQIGVDLRQQWSEFPEQNESARYYDFLAHYTWQEVALHLSWSAEGGLQRQRGLGLNQDFFVARTRLEWMYGKLKFSLGYDYQDQELNGEGRLRHFAYLRFRRNF